MVDANDAGPPERGAVPWIKVVSGAIAFWAGFVALATVYAVLTFGFAREPKHTPIDATIVSTGALFSIVLWLAMRRLTARPFHQQAAVAALLVASTAIAFEVTFRLLMRVVSEAEPPPLDQAGKILSGGMFWLAPFGLWAAGSLALFHDAASRARERRLAAVRAEAQDAQVRALRYQVNPHFLYNTLNSIAALILDRRNDVAEAMVVRLSDFFRASLTNDPTQDVCLADEIALQRLYLDIEQLRFADSLEVDIDLPSELEPARVPSLILQPLVENAIKHGIREAGTKTHLSVTARSSGGSLLLDVIDDGPGGAAAGAGIGLANVRRRLTARFGAAAKVETSSEAGAGFRVSLTMPLVLP